VEMRDELTFEAVLTVVDRFLELPPQEVSSAGGLWPKLDNMLDWALHATKFDTPRHGRLAKLVASLKAAAAKFLQSLLNARRGGSLRDDWTRFAERDFIKLKDEILGLREFLVDEKDFLKFACLRARLRDLSRGDPEKLFNELHEGRAISVAKSAQRPQDFRRAGAHIGLVSRPAGDKEGTKVFGDKDGKVVLAEHGRWIASLRDDARMLEQRLRGLERRVATLEANLTELTKLYGKLDLSQAQLGDELARLASRVDVLIGQLHRSVKSGRRRG